MTQRPAVAVSAPRHDEQARAAFKRRTEEVTAWLDTWPDLRITGRPPGPSDVHGQQNIVLTANRRGRRVVVKVFAGVATDCAAAEAAALARFADFGLPVPAVVEQRTGSLPDGTSCAVLMVAELPGQPLSQVLPVADIATSATAGAAVGRLLAAEYLAERLPVTAPGCAAASWGRVRQRYERTLVDELGVSAGLLVEMDHRARSLPDPPTLGWVTFDWRLRHLLWDGADITGLVDLEYVKPYDSTVELANLLHDLLVGLADERRMAFAHAMLSTYQGRLPDESATDRALLFYMARQALNHAAVKHWQGVTDARPAAEVRLADVYLGANSVDDALTAVPLVPRPRRSHREVP